MTKIQYRLFSDDKEIITETFNCTVCDDFIATEDFDQKITFVPDTAGEYPDRIHILGTEKGDYHVMVLDHIWVTDSKYEGRVDDPGGTLLTLFAQKMSALGTDVKYPTEVVTIAETDFNTGDLDQATSLGILYTNTAFETFIITTTAAMTSTTGEYVSCVYRANAENLCCTFPIYHNAELDQKHIYLKIFGLSDDNKQARILFTKDI